MTGALLALLLAQGLQPYGVQNWTAWTNWNPWGYDSSLVMELPLKTSGPGFWEPPPTTNFIKGDFSNAQWLKSFVVITGTTQISYNNAGSTLNYDTSPYFTTQTATLCAIYTLVTPGTLGGQMRVGVDGNYIYPVLTTTPTAYCVDSPPNPGWLSIDLTPRDQSVTTNVGLVITVTHMTLTAPDVLVRSSVSNVSWNGTALVDSAGLSWTQNGTVPQVLSTALPTTASTGAAGPFSDANYYSYATASDPLDSTGDRFGCVAFVPTTVSATQILFNNGEPTVGGYYVAVGVSDFRFSSFAPAAVVAATGNASSILGFNVGCWWRTGTGIFVKLNLGATGTNAAAGTETSGTARFARVGRYEGAGNSFTGQILHVLQGLGACPTPPVPFAASCEGWAVYQMKRQFGLIGTRGEEISIVRATTATSVVNGLTWNVPAAVPRVTTLGMLEERTSTNYALNNRTHPKAAEASAALSTGAHVAWHEGTGTMTVANGTATTTGLACAAVAPGTLCTFTVTVGGTMALTTSAGTVTKAQIETGSTKSSEIPTAGTAVTRNADVVTVPIPTWTGDVNRWCVEATASPYGGRAWTNTLNQAVVWAGLGVGANTIGLAVTAAGLPRSTVYDSAAVVRNTNSTASITGTGHRVSIGGYSGVATVRVDGTAGAQTASGAGTGLIASFPTTLRLGWDGNGATSLPWDGYVRDVRLYRSPLCR